MNWSNPRRTFESVVDELTEGLGNGTIVLSAIDEELPVENKEQLLEAQQWAPEVVVPREIPEDLQSLRQKRETPSSESPRSLTTAPIADHTIGKGLYIKGEIYGRGGALFIDGNVEGRVNLDGSRVTIGSNGEVHADITAQDITILGGVHGTVSATGRVHISDGGVLVGDIVAERISIEEGAILKGAVTIRDQSAVAREDERHRKLIGLRQREAVKLV